MASGPATTTGPPKNQTNTVTASISQDNATLDTANSNMAPPSPTTSPQGTTSESLVVNIAPAALVCAIILVAIVAILLHRRRKRKRNKPSVTVVPEGDETDPIDVEHMYEDVYNMNHRQAKADKQSDGSHMYYNEIVPTAKANNANNKQKENIKNGAAKNRKQQLAKENKSKESKDKKWKQGKVASKDDDTDTYYNVIGRCDGNKLGHVDNGKGCEKQNPGKSSNTSKITKLHEHDSDDDISYTDEISKIEDLYSKPHKAKKDHVSTSEKPDDKAGSSKNNTISSPKSVSCEKQREVENEKKLKDATIGEADDASCMHSDNEKTEIRRQESEKHDAASAEEQSKTADSPNGKTDNNVKVPASSKEQTATDAPAKNKNGTPVNGEAPPCKPAVHPKPSVIPPSLPFVLPTPQNAKEDEYAYVTAPKEMKIVLDSAHADIIVHDEDKGNNGADNDDISDEDKGNYDADNDDMDSSDEGVSYVTLDHIKGENEEYDIEDPEYYDYDDEVAYAAIRKPDKPSLINTTGEDVTVYVDNDLYSS